MKLKCSYVLVFPRESWLEPTVLAWLWINVPIHFQNCPNLNDILYLSYSIKLSLLMLILCTCVVQNAEMYNDWTRNIASQIRSDQSLSRVRLFATPWIAACQASLSITNSQSSRNSDSRPSSQWCHPAISSSVVPSSPSAPNPSQHQSFPMSKLFTWGGQSIGISASVSVLPINTQDWSPLGWTVGLPCSPRDSQESSPTPQFKTINSSALSLLHSPTLTSIHDHWKNHSLD